MEPNEASEVVVRLRQWVISYYYGSKSLYLFSPEWEAFERSKWEQHSVLEAHRLVFHIPSLAEEVNMEKRRANLLLLKSQRYYPLNETLFDLCPLAVRMDQFEARATQDRMFPWKSLLESWARFQELFASNYDFRCYLSPSQRASYHLLKEWWESSYCDPYLSRMAANYFEERRNKLDVLVLTLDDAVDAKLAVSLYHASCFELFLQEFHPNKWEPYLCLFFLQNLQRLRYHAECHALTQRFSNASLFPPCSGITKSFPTVLLNKLQWTLTKLPTDHPRYLWDTEQMKTVEFESIPGHPEYICISHTWGRWRRKLAPAANIPGVGWRVPTNTRFNVKDLPKKLTHLGHRYIWIDLFCIPQDGSPEAESEINRQASIFRGCRGSIAWLNDVESWKGVQNGLRWLCLKIRHNTMRPYDSPTPGYRSVTELDLAAATLAAQSPSELSQSQSIEPISWFSSLWTLQEAVLCPDIALCSRDWTKLTDDWGVPIPLQSLMIFLEECNKFCVTEGPIDKSFIGAIEYGNVFIHRSPAVICTNANARYCESRNRAPAIMSALGVTEWRERRTLQSPTSSSNPPTKSRPLERLKSKLRLNKPMESLVLEMYPLQFLREAHQRYGGTFFETASIISLNDDVKECLRKRKSIGTMLPFTDKQGWYSGVLGNAEHTIVQAVDHSSVVDWRICEDGSVSMRSIGYVCSSSQDSGGTATRKDIEASIYVWCNGLPTQGPDRSDNLAAYLDSVAGMDGVVYAVQLYENCHLQHGVLLYGLADQVAGPSGQTLLKIGAFVATVPNKVDSRSVDWIVL
ncbi:hypothetical protein PG993_003115 [Apiospora rasikravindrae]|uniref:Heterokaryon incompatibility domain-containing protein n=1 Tax=Apiospora rasikravindrae TaxID=990691 RepID=A0ABR1TYL6_9PEZI